MSLSTPIHPTTAASTPPPVVGRAARRLAEAQGRVWHALTNQREIAVEVGARALVDREGDGLRARIWRLLSAAAAEAKRVGAYDVHSQLVDALGLAERYDELDAAEDGHDASIAAFAEDTRVELRAAAVIHAVLLGRSGGSLRGRRHDG